jgi:hypothetical protein
VLERELAGGARGRPGDAATQSAIVPSPGGGMFGPPMPACELPAKPAARYRSQ